MRLWPLVITNCDNIQPPGSPCDYTNVVASECNKLLLFTDLTSTEISLLRISGQFKYLVTYDNKYLFMEYQYNYLHYRLCIKKMYFHKHIDHNNTFVYGNIKFAL